MPNYELIYIVNPSINEEELPNVLTKVSDMVKKVGGNITETTQWGKKRLAYPIKRFTEGNYILAKFDTEPSAIRKIETSLKLYDEIIRHLVIKISH